MGLENLISMDMGGTSFDVCLIEHDQIPTTAEGWVGDERISIKMVDNLTVGAGGGSVVWIDDFSLLRVGPQSAGADPGPACYGRGGVEPTVTDADVLLGYVPTDYFLGGEIVLDGAQATQAIRTVGTALDLDETHAAEAVFISVNSFMADQITEISTKRGLDIRDFTLVVGGGAGPVHGARIADLLDIKTIVIPRYSALYSAFGMFVMDVGREYVRSYIVSSPEADLAQIAELFGAMKREAIADLRASHVDERDIVFNRTADMRYAGQYHAVEVPLEEVPSNREDIDRTVAAFEARHHELYSFDLPFRTAEFMLFRLKASVEQQKLEPTRATAETSDPSAGLKRTRRCFLGGRWRDTPCFDGELLRAGNTFDGPAIIEEKTTTVLVPAGFSCEVDPARSYILRKETVR